MNTVTFDDDTGWYRVIQDDMWITAVACPFFHVFFAGNKTTSPLKFQGLCSQPFVACRLQAPKHVVRPWGALETVDYF